MLKKYLICFFVSMVPLIELRGAIPISQGMNLPIIPSYFLIIRCQSLIAAMILEVVYCVVLAAAVSKAGFKFVKKQYLRESEQ